MDNIEPAARRVAGRTPRGQSASATCLLNLTDIPRTRKPVPTACPGRTFGCEPFPAFYRASGGRAGARPEGVLEFDGDSAVSRDVSSPSPASPPGSDEGGPPFGPIIVKQVVEPPRGRIPRLRACARPIRSAAPPSQNVGPESVRLRVPPAACSTCLDTACQRPPRANEPSSSRPAGPPRGVPGSSRLRRRARWPRGCRRTRASRTAVSVRHATGEGPPAPAVAGWATLLAELSVCPSDGGTAGSRVRRRISATPSGVSARGWPLPPRRGRVPGLRLRRHAFFVDCRVSLAGRPTCACDWPTLRADPRPGAHR